MSRLTKTNHFLTDYGFTYGNNSGPQGEEGYTNTYRLSDTEEKIRHYILPIRPNRADRRKVTPKPAVYFLYRVA